SLGIDSLSAYLLNPWAWVQFAHNQMAALVTGSFVVAAVGRRAGRPAVRAAEQTGPRRQGNAGGKPPSGVKRHSGKDAWWWGQAGLEWRQEERRELELP